MLNSKIINPKSFENLCYETQQILQSKTRNMYTIKTYRPTLVIFDT